MSKARTTITLNHNLLEEARRYAFENKRTMSDLIAEGLAAVMHEKPRKGKRIVLPTFEGGLRTDISEEALLEMEQHPFLDQFHSLDR